MGLRALRAQGTWVLTQGLDIDARLEGDLGLIGLSGEARVESMPELEAVLQRLPADGARHLLVDLSRLRFMDSASAGALLRAERHQRDRGARLVLHSLHRRVTRLLDAAGLGDHFELAADEPEARARLETA